MASTNEKGSIAEATERYNRLKEQSQSPQFAKKYPEFFKDGEGLHLLEEYRRKGEESIAKVRFISLDQGNSEDNQKAYDTKCSNIEAELIENEERLARHAEAQFKKQEGELREKRKQVEGEKVRHEAERSVLRRQESEQRIKIEHAEETIHALKKTAGVLPAQIETISKQEKVAIDADLDNAIQDTLQNIDIFPESLKIPHNPIFSGKEYCAYALDEAIIVFRRRLLDKIGKILDKILDKKHQLTEEDRDLIAALGKMSPEKKADFLKALGRRLDDEEKAIKVACCKQISESLNKNLRTKAIIALLVFLTAGTALGAVLGGAAAGAAAAALPLLLPLFWGLKPFLQRETTQAFRKHIKSPEFGNAIKDTLFKSITEASHEFGRVVKVTIEDKLTELKGEVEQHEQIILTLKTNEAETERKLSECNTRLYEIELDVELVISNLSMIRKWLSAVPAT